MLNLLINLHWLKEQNENKAYKQMFLTNFLPKIHELSSEESTLQK